MDQQRQLKLNALPDRQPMEPTKYWRNMLTAAGASDKMRCRILKPCSRWNRSSVMPKSSELQ